MTRVFLDHAKHEYTLDGVVQPGVTTILRDQGITPDFSKVDPFYRERGTAVHAAIALDLRDDLVESTVDEHTRPLLGRARRIVSLLEMRPLAIELQMYDALTDTCGTLDGLFMSRLGLMLPDWKAGEFCNGYKVQVVGAYLAMLRQAVERGDLVLPLAHGRLSAEDLRTVKCGVISLATDLPKWIPCPETNERDVYRAACSVWRWRKANGEL